MKDQENAQTGPGWATFPHRRNYSRGIEDVCQAFPLPTHSHRGLREFFGWQWREYGRNRLGEKYARLGTCLGGPCWVTFPQRRNYSRGIGDVWNPSKIKGARETGNNCRKPEKTKRHALFPLIPTRAFESSVDDSKRNMEEIGDKYERSGKFTERTRLSDMSPQKKLFQGYWRCLGPSKHQRWAAADMLQVLN